MTTPKEERRAYSLSALAQLYSVSVGFLRLEVKRGALKVARFGSRVLVLREDWDDYLQRARVPQAEGPK